MSDSPLDKAARLAAEEREREAKATESDEPELDPPFPYKFIPAPLSLFGVK